MHILCRLLARNGSLEHHMLLRVRLFAWTIFLPRCLAVASLSETISLAILWAVVEVASVLKGHDGSKNDPGVVLDEGFQRLFCQAMIQKDFDWLASDLPLQRHDEERSSSPK